MFLLQGAGAVICVWDNWRRRPQPTSPSLNLPSCTSTSPHHRLPPEPPPLFSVLYNLSRRPFTWLSAQHPPISASQASFCVTFSDVPPPLHHLTRPAPSQPKNPSAGYKFASETHAPFCQGHFRGILLHSNPLKGPQKSPDDLLLQLSQVLSEN